MSQRLACGKFSVCQWLLIVWVIYFEITCTYWLLFSESLNMIDSKPIILISTNIGHHQLIMLCCVLVVVYGRIACRKFWLCHLLRIVLGIYFGINLCKLVHVQWKFEHDLNLLDNILRIAWVAISKLTYVLYHHKVVCEKLWLVRVCCIPSHGHAWCWIGNLDCANVPYCYYYLR